MQSIEECLQEELFSKHMGLERIEVMRAHRTNICTRILSPRNRLGGPRPIHVYISRYTDKVRILKAAPKTLKGKKFLDSQNFGHNFRTGAYLVMHASSLYCRNNALAPLKSVNCKALNIFERCSLYLLFILKIRAVFSKY